MFHARMRFFVYVQFGANCNRHGSYRVPTVLPCHAVTQKSIGWGGSSSQCGTVKSGPSDAIQSSSLVWVDWRDWGTPLQLWLKAAARLLAAPSITRFWEHEVPRISFTLRAKHFSPAFVAVSFLGRTGDAIMFRIRIIKNMANNNYQNLN